MGTLFGLYRREQYPERDCVEIPSLMGTLFGQVFFVTEQGDYLSRNTLADGHPIRTTLFPILLQATRQVEIPSLMGTLFGPRS